MKTHDSNETCMVCDPKVTIIPTAYAKQYVLQEAYCPKILGLEREADDRI